MKKRREDNMRPKKRMNHEQNNEDRKFESDSGKYYDKEHYTHTVYHEKMNVEINDDGTYSFY